MKYWQSYFSPSQNNRHSKLNKRNPTIHHHTASTQIERTKLCKLCKHVHCLLRPAYHVQILFCSQMPTLLSNCMIISSPMSVCGTAKCGKMYHMRYGDGGAALVRFYYLQMCHIDWQVFLKQQTTWYFIKSGHHLLVEIDTFSHLKNMWCSDVSLTLLTLLLYSRNKKHKNIYTLRLSTSNIFVTIQLSHRKLLKSYQKSEWFEVMPWVLK